jgi:hypothetical protein
VDQLDAIGGRRERLPARRERGGVAINSNQAGGRCPAQNQGGVAGATDGSIDINPMISGL